MTLAMLLFQVMDAIAKWLVLDDIPAVQIVAMRSWIMLPMILIILVILLLYQIIHLPEWLIL